jgi:hypothetical protein
LPSAPGWLEALAEETFLSEVGDVEIIEMVYQPGADNSEEIAVVRRSLESVRGEYDRGEYRYHGDEEDCQARKGRLSGRPRELSAVPVTEGGCKPSPAGRTYSLDWQAALGCPAQAASGDQCRVQRWWSPRQCAVW